MHKVLCLLVIPIELAICSAQQPTVWDVPAAAKKMKNPVSFTGEKLSAIAKLYDEKCASCHGDKGASNGPAAKALSKEPANFTDSKAMERTKEGELFWKIGKGRAPMPGYEAELSETDRWQLVRYVRYLTGRSQYRYLGVKRAR
jgi:mono/diheme cytochrome c family protein